MSYERLEQLMDEAWELPHSPAQVAVLEEAVRIADSLNNVDASVGTRMELVTAATFSGADEKALVAFAWVLAKFDEDPECVDLHSLLWKYKWIISSIAAFPTVSLEKIHKMEADMEARYTAGGFNLRPVHDSRADIALDIGDDKQCLHFFEQWKATPHDHDGRLHCVRTKLRDSLPEPLRPVRRSTRSSRTDSKWRHELQHRATNHVRPRADSTNAPGPA